MGVQVNSFSHEIRGLAKVAWYVLALVLTTHKSSPIFSLLIESEPLRKKDCKHRECRGFDGVKAPALPVLAVEKVFFMALQKCGISHEHGQGKEGAFCQPCCSEYILL